MRFPCRCLDGWRLPTAIKDARDTKCVQKWCLATAAFGYGTIILVAASHFGLTLRSMANLPIMGVLAASAFVDIRQRIVPDRLVLPGLVWVLGANVFLGIPQAVDGLIGALACGGTLFGFALLSHGSIGGGDVKLMAVVGASLGWRWGFGVLLLSQVAASVAVICLLLIGRKGWKDALPFAPFLVTFTLLAIVAKPM